MNSFHEITLGIGIGENLAGFSRAHACTGIPTGTCFQHDGNKRSDMWFQRLRGFKP
jgi:hypothetical protein